MTANYTTSVSIFIVKLQSETTYLTEWPACVKSGAAAEGETTDQKAQLTYHYNASRAEEETILVNADLQLLRIANHNYYDDEKAGNDRVALRWNVKLCEAKTESDSKSVLVKMYEGGRPTWDLRHKRFPRYLISYQDVCTKIKFRTRFFLLLSQPLFEAVKGTFQHPE
ncbi:hypothetical protein BU17DRAFT_60059 [Hysterangium stoloniferum]|nr:hypothetical protein BU17DRAFT_60059 [Hysterangium stoloniferum]